MRPVSRRRNGFLESADTSILRMVGRSPTAVPTHPTPWIGPPAAAAAYITRVVTQSALRSTSSTKRACGASEGGSRPAWVVGTVANLTHSEAFLSEAPPAIRTGWSDCEDWGALVLGFDDGTVAQISAADIVIGGIQNLLTIYAGRAMINVGTNPNNAVLAYAPTGTPLPTSTSGRRWRPRPAGSSPTPTRTG